MRRAISVFIIGLTLLIGFALSDIQVHADSSYTLLRDKSPGEVVVFSDREWLVLEPSTGLVILKEVMGTSQYYDYNEYKPSHLRATVNNPAFRNTFTDEEWLSIRNWTWYCGYLGNENRDWVNEKIGFLSTIQYDAYKGIPNLNITPSWWLMTPGDFRPLACKVYKDTGRFTAESDSYAGVRPCLHLLPDSKVDNDTNRVFNFSLIQDIAIDEELVYEGETWVLKTPDTGLIQLKGSTEERLLSWNHVVSDITKNVMNSSYYPKVSIESIKNSPDDNLVNVVEAKVDGENIIERGIIYNIDEHVSREDNKLIDTRTEAGNYSIPIRVYPDHTYYIRAYASNLDGTSYSQNQLSLVTGLCR